MRNERLKKGRKTAASTAAVVYSSIDDVVDHFQAKAGQRMVALG